MKKTRAIFLVIALVAVTGLVSVAHARAKQQAASASQQQNFFIHDEASFLANSKVFHAIPFNDPKFEFDVRLPKDWTVDMLAKDREEIVDQRLLSDVARFKSPRYGTAQITLKIQFVQLQHDISPENWLKKYAVSNGYMQEEPIASAGKKRASMGYISVFENINTYASVLTQINGGVLMLVSAEIPLYLRETLGFVQKSIVDSFRMIISEEKLAESLQTFSLADALKFSYPTSWQINHSDFRNTNSVAVQLHNEPVPDQLNGIVRMTAIHRATDTNLVEEMGKLRDEYFGETLKLSIDKMVSSQDNKSSDRFLFSRREVYLVTAKAASSRTQELHLVVLGDRRWYVIAFLLTPAETDSLSIWAQNIESFDTMVRTIR